MTSSYPPELKAQAISEWMAGASLNDLSQRLDVPKSTLQGWVAGRTRTEVVPKPNPEAESLDELAWGWAHGNFLASAAILRKAQDDSWLDRQSAHDLGVFYGIIADKQLRLLAAFKPPADNPSEPAAVAS